MYVYRIYASPRLLKNLIFVLRHEARQWYPPFFFFPFEKSWLAGWLAVRLELNPF